jgi:probable F420-dependent oxidoreductase
MRLSGTGVWAWQLRMGDAGEIADAAAELEELGYTALWVPDVSGDVLSAVEALLRATRETVVATGILNVWLNDADDVAARRAAWSGEWQSRVLLGLGVSHASFIDRLDLGRWDRPLSRVRDYLDRLDASPTPVPRDARVLAALGPRMLELARNASAGAHPYFVTPEHTATARSILGVGPLLAPEQAVVLDSDVSAARAVARAHVAGYLNLPNYVNNLRRLGWGDDDVRDGGSDRLVDAVVAHGDVDAVAARIRAHRDAGADHVCIQVLNADNSMARREWRELAPALTG